MNPYSLKELLAKCLEDGFPMASICKATGISRDLLEKYIDGNELLMDELPALQYLPIFLTQLYIANPILHEYSISLLEALNYYFDIPNEAIENYIGLERGGLNLYVNSPEKVGDKEIIERRIMHLFCTFVRNREHSFNCKGD